MTAPAERPILFTGPMVRACLDGSKTQTRRVVKPPPPAADEVFCWSAPGEYGKKAAEGLYYRDASGLHFHARCPYGVPGDLLYVRETWAKPFEGPRGYIFRADGPEYLSPANRSHNWGAEATWKPSIHMPKAASRLWLRVTEVRVERVQDITTADVWAEGVKVPCFEDGRPLVRMARTDGSPAAVSFLPRGRLLTGNPPLTEDELARIYFAELWESINGGKRGYGWELNPWVWVIGFEIAEAPR